MKKRTILTALVAGTLLSGVALSTAIAGPGFGPCGCGNCDGPDSATMQQRMENRMERHLAKMTTVLELTDSQQTQIKDILAAQQEKRQAERQERYETREQMQELKASTDFNEAEFRALAKERAEKRIDMQVERMKTRQQIFALLTPEQQEKAEVFFQAMGKRGHGHGHGMRH